MLNSERRLANRDALEWNPFDDIDTSRSLTRLLYCTPAPAAGINQTPYTLIGYALKLSAEHELLR
jgi:hypothetical protein